MKNVGAIDIHNSVEIYQDKIDHANGLPISRSRPLVAKTTMELLRHYIHGVLIAAVLIGLDKCLSQR